MNQAEEEDDEDGETTLMRSEFDTQSPPQLCEVDIIVKQGELIGICGMKGSGKTSFLSAILGRMQQLGGTVRIAGSMAYVGQEPWIINGTARDNILFGKPYDEERYKQTIACCYLEKDFETFSARDKVEIGDRGLTLSGGQKQRISLARAVYSNSDIYLLDDPLSALDVHIGRHYLPKCDRVMLIHDGRVEECGSHSQLLETGVGPMYTELYQLYQSKYEKVQRHRLISMRGPSQEAVKTPQRGFSRLTRRTLSKQLSRMSTNSGIQHQFSTMSTTSGIFGDYDYVDIEDLVESNELNSTKVSWSVYWQYIRAMGGLAILIFLLVSFAVSIAVQSAATWFLAFWLMQGNGSTPDITGSWDNTSFTGSHTAGSVADHPSVQTFALVYGLFLLTMLIIMLFRSIIFVKILLKAASNLHGKLLRKTMTCPMKFFDTTPLGTILNRFSADIDEIDVRLPSNCELYLQNIFLVLLALIMICYTFPWDLLVVAPLAVVFVVLAIMFAPVVQQLKFVDSITRAPYLSHLALSMEGITTIHTFGQSERFFKQFCDMLDQNNIPFFLFYMANRWLAIFLDLMTVTIMGVTGFLIVFTVTDSTTSQAGLALTFAFQITSLFQYTLRLTIETGSRFSSVHRVQEYIERVPLLVLAARCQLIGLTKGPSTFNKYRMRYNDNLPLALKGVTLGIKPNEKIGIVGNSGSGKSSLGIALFRLSEAASGAIYIDDINIRDIKLSALRSRISILVQDPVLFVGTIRYNLDPAGQHPQDDILWQALAKCHMKEKIQSLEGQLDGMVEENGKNFSMGERQLLCLARTLLRKSKILVLDEATASIDTRTEVLVQHTIRECCRDCTVLTIAHRINTIWDCDKVLVMEDGKPVEYNQPSVLLQKSQSKFKAMFDAMKATPRGDSINEEDEPDKRDSLGCDDAIS
ncbi:hypothetical protein C0Q70_20903 [Pomacea canaliculata]|uniref:Uncharacterized protein n=1 Tax=Pomacea canaliculata TaxID=400727 RepID=A0A2T7NB08_POMCA|nr:hypothetical protein C0Q70_20903 [Pomacea canaliculata]